MSAWARAHARCDVVYGMRACYGYASLFAMGVSFGMGRAGGIVGGGRAEQWHLSAPRARQARALLHPPRRRSCRRRILAWRRPCAPGRRLRGEVDRRGSSIDPPPLSLCSRRGAAGPVSIGTLHRCFPQRPPSGGVHIVLGRTQRSPGSQECVSTREQSRSVSDLRQLWCSGCERLSSEAVLLGLVAPLNRDSEAALVRRRGFAQERELQSLRMDATTTRKASRPAISSIEGLVSTALKACTLTL